MQNEAIFSHPAHRNFNGELRSLKIPRHLPLPRRIQKAQYSRGYERGGHFRNGAFHSCNLPNQSVPFSKNGLEYLQTLVFILVIAALVQLVEIALKKFLPALYNSLGIYLPLITTNCAVLGVVLLNIDKSYSFWQSIVNSLGAGLGFMLAMVLFAGVRERLESCEVPKFLQGLPITLIAASLVSVSFLGFTGIVEGMFH